jgi:DNA topoisomerase-2
VEINHIKQILGLQHGKVYTDIKSLRYGHLMIMTDQDHDGSHIKGLLINFLHHFFPSLLKVLPSGSRPVIVSRMRGQVRCTRCAAR